MKLRNRVALRAGLVVFALLAALLAKDVWLKRWIVLREAVTGARVEIGNLKSNLATGELVLTDLQIADPHAPMLNLLQADRVSLFLDRSHVLRRRIVIDSGYLQNVQVDTPRTISGGLGAVAPRADGPVRWLPQAFQQKLEELGTRFLDCVEVRQSVTPPGESSLAAVANEIRQAIPDKFVVLLEQAQHISQQIARLSSELNRPADNPLREPERLRNVAAQLPQVEQAAHTSRATAQSLKAQFASDLKRLERAKQADLASSKCRVTVADLEPELLQAILVSPQQLAQVDEALQWVRWLRASIPSEADSFAPRTPAGIDVQYQAAPVPDLVFSSLKFDGAAQVGGRSQKMFGTIRNWTLPLAQNPHPILFEVRLQGSAHLLLTAELDRRHGARCDRIRISQPEVQTTPQTLGTEGIVQVAVSPSRQLVDVDLTIDGDEIDGLIRFRHAAASLSVATLHELAGGAEMMSWVNQELANVRQFETNLHLSGTLDDIHIACDCDLARCIASAAAKSAGLEIRHARTTYQDQIENEYTAALKMLNAEFDRQQQNLMAQLQNDLSRVHQLQQTANQSDSPDAIRR